MFAFEHLWLSHAHPTWAKEQVLVGLGRRSVCSHWTLVSIEPIWTGEELITLKARSSLGALPDLDHQLIPSGELSKVVEAIALVAEAIHRSGPESVVDRCRDAASTLLAARLRQEAPTKQGLDLHGLIGEWKKQETLKRMTIILNSADSIRLLHGRAKPAVQEQMRLRPIFEQDAELAVHCLGVIIADLEWGRWV